jgi:hypothetical protein
VDSEKNIADIGSKAIFGQDFKFKRQGLIGLQEGEVAVQPLKRPKKVTFNDVIDGDVSPVVCYEISLMYI